MISGAPKSYLVVVFHVHTVIWLYWNWLVIIQHSNPTLCIISYNIRWVNTSIFPLLFHRIYFCCCCCLNTGWARPFKLLIIHVISSNTHSVVNCCTFGAFYLLGEGIARLTKDISRNILQIPALRKLWFCSKCIFFHFFLPPSLSFISSPLSYVPFLLSLWW